MSYSNDWMQLNFIDDNRIDNDTPPTTITTTTTAAASTAINNIPPPDHGRGARPIRRRSRASRRTPTTLLNTDTTNFRAMVQQFTGSPTTTAAANAATPQHANAAGIFNFTQHIVPSGLYEGGGAHVQYHQNQMQQRRHVFMVGDHAHGGGGGGGGGAHAPPESSTPKESRDYDDYML